MSMEFNYDKEAEITGVKCSKEISNYPFGMVL